MNNNKTMLKRFLILVSLILFSFLYYTDGNSLMKSIIFGVIASVVMEVIHRLVSKPK
jgi:hypothetical protein